MTRGWAAAASFCAVVAACNDNPEHHGLVAAARFGVFFGGEVQELEQIPFELDRSKQTLGFRVVFRRPLARDVPVRWEVDMPGTSRRVRDRYGRIGKGRLVKLRRATVRAGQKRFDRSLSFEPGDPLGVWNVRLIVDRILVVDRAFQVYDARARRRRLSRDAGR